MVTTSEASGMNGQEVANAGCVQEGLEEVIVPSCSCKMGCYAHRKKQKQQRYLVVLFV
jgi:hypothetical protein